MKEVKSHGLSLSIEDARALFESGRDYFKGQGPVKNWKVARSHILQAAGAGLADAQYYLFDHCLNGQARPLCTVRQAYDWRKKAALNGHFKAMLRLAVSFELGTRPFAIDQTPKPNYEKAFSLYKAAADAGDDESAFHLARMFQRGRGCQKDELKAFELHHRGARAQIPAAMIEIACAYRDGRIVGKDIKQALRWFKAASLIDNGSADYVLGTMYLEGTGVRRNAARALAYLHKAAGRGVGRAMNLLGNHFCDGTGGEKDMLKALEWYEKGAIRGDPDAQFNLAEALKYGDGLQKDLGKALGWFLVLAYFGPYKTEAEARILKIEPLLNSSEIEMARAWADSFTLSPEGAMP